MKTTTDILNEDLDKERLAYEKRQATFDKNTALKLTEECYLVAIDNGLNENREITHVYLIFRYFDKEYEVYLWLSHLKTRNFYPLLLFPVADKEKEEHKYLRDLLNTKYALQFIRKEVKNHILKEQIRNEQQK